MARIFVLDKFPGIELVARDVRSPIDRMADWLSQPVFNASYRKVGGLHFFKVGRFGASFWISKPK